MSEVLLGILRMPHPDDNPVITRQFIAAARNAADEIERLQSLLDAEIASNHRLSERELSLAEAIERIDALEAIRDKLREYEHHNFQAASDMEDGAIDPLFYDNAEQEVDAADECLRAAVLMARGMDKEAAERMAEQNE